MSDIKIVRNYINGEWVQVSNATLLDVENPSTGDVLAKVPLSPVAEVYRQAGPLSEARR